MSSDYKPNYEKPQPIVEMLRALRMTNASLKTTLPSNFYL
jgi:hypothetical protein